MKKGRLYLLLLLSCMTAGVMQGQSLTLMTYNIRLDTDADGVNSWSNRKDYFLAQLKFYEPDILGVQEVLPRQVKDLSDALDAYGRAGIARDGNGKGESSNIFYKKKRFALKDSGTFWLSPTPDTISRGWDAALNRVCTYVRLLDRRMKKHCWVFNTHLDHIGVTARTKSIELILAKIRELNSKGEPVMLMGDLNSTPDEERIRNLSAQLLDTRSAARQQPFGPEGTFNNFKHNEPVTKRIDYIFLSPNSPFTVNKYAVLSDSKDLRYPSDHLPVWVELLYNK